MPRRLRGCVMSFHANNKVGAHDSPSGSDTKTGLSNLDHLSLAKGSKSPHRRNQPQPCRVRTRGDGSSNTAVTSRPLSTLSLLEAHHRISPGSSGRMELGTRDNDGNNARKGSTPTTNKEKRSSTPSLPWHNQYRKGYWMKSGDIHVTFMAITGMTDTHVRYYPTSYTQFLDKLVAWHAEVSIVLLVLLRLEPALHPYHASLRSGKQM